MDANFERTADKNLSWVERRERVGIPSQDEITFFMQKKFPLIRSSLIGMFTKEQEIVSVQQLLKEQKLDVQKNLSVSLSKPSLCAIFLSRSVGDELTSEARDAFNENNMQNFRFLSDVSIVLLKSWNRVMRAEAELSDTGETARLAIVSYWVDKINIPMAEQTQQFLDMKREDIEFLELLRKDPSGFLLMDNFVEGVKAMSWGIGAYRAKEYVLAGAEMARDLYKSLYEIAAPLYPEKESK